jgi:hypothetical protein
VAIQSVSREQRLEIATRRLVRVLDSLTVANMRTLEMKISDSGPPGTRIDPHILTEARNALVNSKRLIRVDDVWYHRFLVDKAVLATRIDKLKKLHSQTTDRAFVLRLGQALEISIQKSLDQSDLEFVGAFLDIDEHDDGALYRKEEPPLRFSGSRMPGQKRFDFLAFHPTAGRLGIEAKNIREWVYPRRPEIKELLQKALSADAVPVLIARRVPYVTIRLLSRCGMMIFQTFNQIYPDADASLAALVRIKEDLGYHDVRVGNAPSPHLLKFLTQTLTAEAPAYRERFEQHKDLLEDFSSGEMSYASFAARVRRREAGLSEDSDDDRHDSGFNPDDLDWH